MEEKTPPKRAAIHPITHQHPFTESIQQPFADRAGYRDTTPGEVTR